MDFIGREGEAAKILKLENSSKAEFLALYGRRRVGKTYLIKALYRELFAFYVTGVANVSVTEQLINFNLALKKYSKKKWDMPENWLYAFQQLIEHLEKSKQKKKIIFIDELPWFDTPNARFLQALEHFWNSWASARKDIFLIVCGSAASWMLTKLIHNKGGLYNRVTYRMKIEPFTLRECSLFLQKRKIALDAYQIIQLYMVLGGIPFYWETVSRGRSAAQIIEEVCFSEGGLLQNEFHAVFQSLFNQPERHLSIVKTLATKAKGLLRGEIASLSGLSNGGGLSRLLKELEESGFITSYVPFGKASRNTLYQLSDFYSLFYLKFLFRQNRGGKNQWIKMIDSPTHRAWSGYAFEQVCLYHIQQLQQALGISGMQTQVSSWRSASDKRGAQIDLIIDRRDQVINLCEMKFSINPFVISKKYADELRNKIGCFKSETLTRKAVFLTMITTFGVTNNQHSGSVVQNDLTMDVLFQS
jgi:uncharacterized protein